MKSRTSQLQEIMEGFHSLRMNLAAGRRHLPEALRITGSQWLVLGVIARHKTLSVKEVSKALDITPSAATQIVGELVKSGNVVKSVDEKDHRAVMLSLSKKARTHLASMRSAMVKQMGALYAPLSDGEFATYVRLSRKVIGAAEKSKHP